MSRPEFSSFRFEVKSVDSDGSEFSGMVACYNNIDNGRDIIAPGAYSRYLGQFRIEGKVRDEHSVTTGRIVEATETPQGLFIAGKISDTTAGRDQKTLLRDGVLTRLSIGHYVTGREYLESPAEVKSFWGKSGYQPAESDLVRSGSGGVRLITEARPVEASTTFNPMNEKCAITSVKSNGQPAGRTFADHSENTLAVLEEFSERATRLFEKRADSGRTLSRKHVADFRRLSDRLLTLLDAVEKPEAKADAEVTPAPEPAPAPVPAEAAIVAPVEVEVEAEAPAAVEVPATQPAAEPEPEVEPEPKSEADAPEIKADETPGAPAPAADEAPAAVADDGEAARLYAEYLRIEAALNGAL